MEQLKSKTRTGYQDVKGKEICQGDTLLIKGQYTGEVFKQHGRWLVAVETLRFMFPMTILPVDVAVKVYKAEVRTNGKN